MKCIACGHDQHKRECVVRLPWWRRWFSGLEICKCTYYDPRTDVHG